MTEIASYAGASRVIRREWAAIAGLTLLAGALRLWRLGELPPGLHVDEAFNLLDAREVIAGWRPVFLPANAGREVLFTYLQAPLVALFGESALTARLVSALAGTLLVPVTWGFTRELPTARPRRVALIAAAFVAFSYWHLHFSRFGIRAVLFPLVATAAMWAWWRTVAQVTRLDGARTSAGIRHPTEVAPHGAFLGLACYVHPAGRVLFVVPLLDALWHAWRHRDRRPLVALVPALVIGAVVALPLAAWWWQHPGTFIAHAGEVSIISRGPGAVAVNAAKVAGMFNVAGDPEGWRNLIARPATQALLERTGVDPSDPLALALRGRPVFDPLTGVLFLGGLAMTVVAARRGAAWATLILSWLAVMLLPSVLTDAAPNFSRTIGAVVPVCLMPALALDELADRLAMRREGRERRVVASLIVLWLGLSAAWTVRDYFGTWARDPETVIAFDGDKVALARYADRRAAEGRTVYTSPALATHPTVRVVAGTPPRGLDLAQGVVVPTLGPQVADYVLPEDDPAWTALGERLGPALSVEPIEAQEDWHRAAASVVGARAGLLDGRFEVGEISTPIGAPVAAYAYPLWLLSALKLSPGAVTFGQDARLLYARATPFQITRTNSQSADGTLQASSHLTTTVTLVWEALAPTATDLSAMVHLGTPDGRGLASGDGGPVGGSYPTTRWRPGDVVFETRTVSFAAPPSSPVVAGPLEVRVGWYDWRTGERLRVTAGPDDLVREDGTAVIAATVDVFPPD